MRFKEKDKPAPSAFVRSYDLSSIRRYTEVSKDERVIYTYPYEADFDALYERFEAASKQWSDGWCDDLKIEMRCVANGSGKAFGVIGYRGAKPFASVRFEKQGRSSKFAKFVAMAEPWVDDAMFSKLIAVLADAIE